MPPPPSCRLPSAAYNRRQLFFLKPPPAQASGRRLKPSPPGIRLRRARLDHLRLAQPPPEGIAYDFFEQIFSMPGYAVSNGHSVPEIVSQFNSGDCSAPGSFPVFPLSLSLVQGRTSFALAEDGSGGAGGGKRLCEPAEGKTSSDAERDPVQLTSLFPSFEHVQSNQIRPNPPQILRGQSLEASIAPAALLQAPRPRVRARHGQATDPHSIAERGMSSREAIIL